ncbi:mushroom body defect isoform X2 [Colletes latitarsis]|uniref:mushroom body defect isoform X2 n=1 Tax=Colletes latitarsis TaxID=2605962 RepID=UPI0040362178
MRLWLQVILEWLNSLDVIERNVTDLKELEDGEFYKKLIELCSWEGDKENLGTNRVITQFLQDDYPEFKFDEECVGEMEQLDVASLFLLHVCQHEPIFYGPMSNKLQHKTQLKIKTFVEMSIPFEKRINREILRRIITEVEGNNVPKTPMTPKTQSLKDFLSSPIAQSAQNYKLLNERNRELRRLRSQLEVEKFEKTDLQEDIKIQQNKVQSLQKKLQEKITEIAVLREEIMKTHTPQSCTTNENTTDREQYYKREINYLEDALVQKQDEIDKLEIENDSLSKKLAQTKKENIYFREKIENCEKSLEKFQIQGEIKDEELMNLRSTNEELCTYLKELNKTHITERSFEIDGVAPLSPSLLPLNNSEALSSIIEIQLQEAKEESASLKTQLDVLNKKLEFNSQDYKCVTQQLQEKTVMLQDTETKLNTALNKLTKKVESLQEEKMSLTNQNQNLENLCTSQKESLIQIEESKNILSIEVVSLKEKLKNVEESLENESKNIVKLNNELMEAKAQIHENVKCIEDLTHQNNSYKTFIENCNTNLKEILIHNLEINNSENDNLDGATTIQLIQALYTLLHNFEEKYILQETKIKSLNNATEDMKLKAQQYQSQIFELEKKDKQNNMEMSKFEETITQNMIKIRELTTTVDQYITEISCLKKIQFQKQALENEVRTLTEEVNEKNVALKSSMIGMKTLQENFHVFVTEFYSTKKNLFHLLNECQKQNEETIKNILDAYKIMYNNFTKEQLHRKEIEDKLADNRKELKDSRNLNTTLKDNLSKYKQSISDLEAGAISAKERLMISEQKLEKLEEKNETLEKQRKNLKSQSEQILLDLNNINDKLKLFQQEACNMSDRLRFKDARIENLIAEITSLQLEKKHIVHLKMEEESKTKTFIKELEIKLLEQQQKLDQLNVETKLKQETLDLVRNKFENLSKETIASEIKMKEIILNFQEVRTNQDAVLATQEKALKEKTLQLDQIQKEFYELKNALHKQLENEKLLCQNLQSKNSELQIESYKQMKSMEELQVLLKREKSEHDKSKEYCKIEDIKKLETVRVCKELEHSITDLKLIIAEASSNDENVYEDEYDFSWTDNSDKTDDVVNTVRTSINTVNASRKCILYLSNINTNLNETLQKQKLIVDNYDTKCEEIELLKNKMQELENLEEKRIKHLNDLIKHKESLRDSLQNIIKSRESLNISIDELKQKWDKLLIKFFSIFAMDKSVCDVLKHIQTKRTHLENTLSRLNVHHLQNIKFLYTILWQKLLWTEQTLKNTYLNPTNNEQAFDNFSFDNFSDERTVMQIELQKSMILQKDIKFHDEINDFSNLVTTFEINFNSDEVKYQSEIEKKLKLQVNELLEEKNDLRSKLDCAHMKNTELEGHIEELKAPLLKSIENFKVEIMQSKKEILKLQEERDELSKRIKKEDVDSQLKDIHDKYKNKLDEIKLKMKTAYNEQISKMNREQDQCIQERLESLQRKMEIQCRKQADELSKYKAHVADMSSQIWNVGEKLLSERQEKEKLQNELTELQAKYQNFDQQIVSSMGHETSNYEKRNLLSGENKEEVLHKIAVIQEKTTYERRCSIRSIQSMGNAFNAEDEEGEIFDNIYLADMKNGHSSLDTDIDRLSILKKRNALCKPHLKSSYPAEMQFHPLSFTEEEIKTGSVTDEVFNDSLSQSLLPEHKVKKKDRTQTSYKKPGPPTPSKNGGKASLQSPNSRILRERNKDRTTTTPRTLKSLFTSRRQDENVTVTPKGRRRSSIFRKCRAMNDR